ncbi:MAG TPA: hypothetical protein VHG51_10505 [Longimicrobiaceae bacterium]|nr:hypothetical protein [Longimicrobiaceae bacterium]
MADIDIERKGGSIWPWILGLLALLLLGWLLWEWLDDDTQAATDPAAVVTDPAMSPAAPPATDTTGGAIAAATPAAVQQYTSTCAPQDAAAMSLDHRYTSDCIQRLVASAEAVLQDPNMAGVDVQAQVQDARQAAERLVQTPETSSEHAGMTRTAFASLATLLGAIQDQRFPALDSQASQLEQAAQSVQPSQPMLSQRQAVQSFFRRAGDLLRGMAGAPATA